jgi:hypothetical protein
MNDHSPTALRDLALSYTAQVIATTNQLVRLCPEKHRLSMVATLSDWCDLLLQLSSEEMGDPACIERARLNLVDELRTRLVLIQAARSSTAAPPGDRGVN